MADYAEYAPSAFDEGVPEGEGVGTEEGMREVVWGMLYTAMAIGFDGADGDTCGIVCDVRTDRVTEKTAKMMHMPEPHTAARTL